MDLLTALRILLRRWPVVLVGLLITGIGYHQVGQMIEPTYEAKTTVMFLSPKAEAGDNPFSQFGANLDIAAQAMKNVMESTTGARRLDDEGATGSFKIEALGGPLLDITSDDASKKGAVHDIDAMVTSIQKEMVVQQNNAPLAKQITVKALNPPVPKAKFGSRIRAQFAVVAIGLAATAAAGLATDALMLQYRDAKARRRDEEDDWDEAGYQPDGPYSAPAPGLGSRAAQPSHSTYRPASRPAPASSPGSGPQQPQPASASSRPVNGAAGGSGAAPVNGDGRGAPAGTRPSGGSSGRPGGPRPAPGAPTAPPRSQPAPSGSGSPSGAPSAPSRGPSAPSGGPSGAPAAPTRGPSAPSGSGSPSGRPRPPAGPAGQPSGGSGPGSRPAHATGNGSRPTAPSPGPSRSAPPSGGPAATAAPAGAATAGAGDAADLRSQIGQLTSSNGSAGTRVEHADANGAGQHASTTNGSGRPAPDTRGPQGQRATWR